MKDSSGEGGDVPGIWKSRTPGDDPDILSKVSPRTSSRKQVPPPTAPAHFLGSWEPPWKPAVGQSFHPSLPVDQTLSPRPDCLGPIHQAPGEVASPRLKGRPRPAGSPAPPHLCPGETGWGWSRSRRQKASERTPSSFSGYKACGQRRALRKLPQAPLGTEEAPTGQVLPGQSWGKGPGTAPSCVSPNQPPRFPPSAAPSPPIPERWESRH